MKPVPIETLPLLPVLDDLLDELLRSLSPADWEQPTIAGRWRVRDVALHLLDGSLRNVSMLRDGHFGAAPEGDLSQYDNLVGFINALNNDWVKVGQRLSPRLITDLLRWSGREFNALLATLDPWAPALFSVAWAGEAASQNWFHVAREYTERWHHQAQIRLAVGQEAPLYAPELYRPYLETSVRALPHQLRPVAAAPGTVLRYEVTGSGGGTWHLRRGAADWQLVERDGVEAVAHARVQVAGPVAWRLLTKGITRAEAEPYVRLEGDQQLAERALQTVAVMA